MLWVAKLAMRGPLSASALAAALLLGCPIPIVFLGVFALPLSYLMLASSGAVMTLVMLRQGERAAGRALGLGVAFLLVVFLATGVSVLQALGASFVFWGLAVAAGWVLRTTIRLDLAILLIAAAVAVVMIGVFLIVGDPTQIWLRLLETALTKAQSLAENDAAMSQLISKQQELVGTLARMMTGGIATAVFWIATAAMLLARSWQARLYNPDGFQPEFHSLSFGRSATLIGAAVIVGVWATGWSLLAALSMLVIAVFLIQGLAVAHALVKKHGMSRGWLIGMYILLLQIMILVAALGMLDNWLNLRRQNTSSGN